MPEVPLRIGLVASPGSEGYNDFVGQLRASDLAFSVVLFRANVQGAGAPASIARALGRCVGSDCDLAVLVRGGGSRGDLAAFDAEPVARAIATLPMPLWTGIGHTGDQSVADIVANRAFVTPTACGQELVHRVGEWWESVAGRAPTSADCAVDALSRPPTQRDAAARRRLRHGHAQPAVRHSERLERRVAQIATNARRQLDVAGDAVELRASRIGPGHWPSSTASTTSTATWRRLLAAYDIERQLERGYTITLGPMAPWCARRREPSSPGPRARHEVRRRPSALDRGRNRARSTTEGDSHECRTCDDDGRTTTTR